MRKATIVTRASIVALTLLIAAPSASLAQTPPPPAAKTSSVKTWDKIAGSWKRMKGGIKRQWGKLTHNDIAEANGKRDVLAGKIQQRYGIDKAKADAQIDEWLKGQK
jgi:uncharacterized protein YjbJ (UPF0337 family)